MYQSIRKSFVALSLLIGGGADLCEAQPPKEITNSIGMKLVLIPKGTFTMGSPETEKSRHENETQREVTISKDYYLGVYEVTQAKYEKVMGKNPSHFQGAIVGNENADLPVENVSWDDTVEFCKRLSDLPEEKKAGRVYRLPTEAEWEYACRAGSKTAYSFDDEEGLLPEYGWFRRNSSQRTHTVGLLEPNAWGLYDMHGNVVEWCSDWYGEYPKGAVSDPTGPRKGGNRVARGGSWYFDAAVYASIWHNRGMLPWLLAQGVDPDCRMGKLGNTPLMQAASDGDVWAIEILLQFGADPNALNEHQENPLGFATSWKQLDSIKLLVAAGADINDTLDAGPLRTQLDWAELSSWQPGADLLRSLGGRRFIELDNRSKDAEVG